MSNIATLVLCVLLFALWLQYFHMWQRLRMTQQHNEQLEAMLATRDRQIDESKVEVARLRDLVSSRRKELFARALSGRTTDA